MKFKDYENKMKRVRTVRNGMYHMRFVFLGAALLGVAAGSSIMACTGMVQEAEIAKNTYAYGEDFNLEGNAFLSDVVYEYCQYGTDNWTTIKPVNAGKYQYRYYTKDTFGGKKYSAPVTFNIEPQPLELSIRDSRIVYGDRPCLNEYSLSLRGQDYLDSYDFTYVDITQNPTQIHVDLDSVVIKNKDEADVTSNYAITVPQRSLLLDNRHITIHYAGDIDGKPHVYDNTDYTNTATPEIIDGTLASGDTIEYLDPIILHDVGRKQNDRGCIIKNKDGIDVTKYYGIQSKAEFLSVIPREITVRSADLSVTYDGEIAKQEATIVSDTKLAPGHKLDVRFTNPDSWRVGEYVSSFICQIVDENTLEPIHDNQYKIKTEFGKIKILPRNLDVITRSDFKYYDGTNIRNTDYSVSGLASGDTTIIKNEKFTAFSEIGTKENVMDVEIKRGKIDVTDCYNINKSFGTLSIYKRPIVVSLDTLTEIPYDGIGISVDTSKFHVLSKQENAESEGLAPNHIARAHVVESATLINVGNYDFSRFAVDIYEVNPLTKNETIVNDKYDIKYLNKDTPIRITPLHITIKTPDINETYDGAKHVSETPILVSGHLADGDSFACQAKQEFIDATDKPIKNELTHCIVNKNGEDVTRNYVFDDIILGDIQINKENIIVSPKDQTIDYNDSKYDVTNAELNIDWPNGKLIQGDIKAYGHISSNQIDATSTNAPADITLDMDSVKIIKDSKEDITKNFSITNNPSLGKLTINKLPVNIGVKGKEIAFEENPNLLLQDEDCTIEGLLPNHRVQNVVYDGKINRPDEGTSEISVKSYEIYSLSRDKVVTQNYDELVKNSGKFTTFYKTPLKFESPDVQKIYDGFPLKLTEDLKQKVRVTGLDETKYKAVYTWNLDSLDQQLVNVIDTAQIYGQDVTYGKYRNTFTARIVMKDNPDKDVTDCFSKIEYSYGTVKILPRTLEIIGRDKGKVYNGQNNVVEDLNPTDMRGFKVEKNPRNPVYLRGGDGMAPNESLYIQNYGASGINPGSYSLFHNASMTVYNDLTGETVNSYNYNWSAKGNLIIQKANAHITTNTYNMLYDPMKGQQFENEYTASKLVEGHVWVIQMREFTSVTPGKVLNEPIYYYIVEEKYRYESEDILRMYDLKYIYYNFTYTWGTVDIHK